MTRVALIDDHESVRLGLEAALARVGHDLVFSGATVGDYLEWRYRERSAPADVVVLDLSLGDGSTVMHLMQTAISPRRGDGADAAMVPGFQGLHSALR